MAGQKNDGRAVFEGFLVSGGRKVRNIDPAPYGGVQVALCFLRGGLIAAVWEESGGALGPEAFEGFGLAEVIGG